MPSVRHEASTYSLYEQPEIALGLLVATGVILPEHDLVHVDSPKLPDLVPTDFEADAVFTVLRSGAALSPLNHGTYAGYYRLIEAALPAASRRFLEELMRSARTPYKSEWANKHHAEGYDEGRVEGLARAVLELLDSHRVRLSERNRRQIAECDDESQLLTWLRKAADATSADEVFA